LVALDMLSPSRSEQIDLFQNNRTDGSIPLRSEEWRRKLQR
jgi:hypothetical protein